MAQFTPKPHVSTALSHLRYGVTTCALIVALAAAVQLLVFGFVHFTEVRWVEPRAEAEAVPLRVVTAPVAAVKQISAAPAAPVARAPRNLSSTDAALRTVSDCAVTSGVVCASLLAVFCYLGVAVAGGASVPGVQYATSAAVWAALLGVACVPIQQILPSVPYGGVFGPYDAMTAMSHAVDRAGGSQLALMTHFVVMPLAALGGAFLVLGRFRSGIAAGVIVTSVSELDERMEREIATIRNRGAASPAARAIGALHSAIGEVPEGAPQLAAAGVGPAPEMPVRKQAVPAPARTRNWLHRERGIGEPDPGDALKRPI